MIIKNPTLEQELSADFINSISVLSDDQKEDYITRGITFMNNFHMLLMDSTRKMYDSIPGYLDKKYLNGSELKQSHTIRSFLDLVVETGKEMNVVVENDSEFKKMEFIEREKMIFPVYVELRSQGYTREDLVI